MDFNLAFIISQNLNLRLKILSFLLLNLPLILPLKILLPFFYSNLILYFLILTTIKNNVIPTRINVSFQITANPAPLSIIAFIMIMNHLAGIILLITCNGKGILEIGKMNPDNKITGNISPNNEIIIAVCCESDIVEIKIPSVKAQIINKTLSAANKTKLPSMGISKTK